MFEFRRILNAIAVLRGDAIAAYKPETWPRLPRRQPKRETLVFHNTPGDMVTLENVGEHVFFDGGGDERVSAHGVRIAGVLMGFDRSSGLPLVQVS